MAKKNNLFLIVMFVVLLSISFVYLVEAGNKPQGSKTDKIDNLEVDWTHTYNGLTKQEFNVTISQNSSKNKDRDVDINITLDETNYNASKSDIIVYEWVNYSHTFVIADTCLFAVKNFTTNTTYNWINISITDSGICGLTNRNLSYFDWKEINTATKNKGFNSLNKSIGIKTLKKKNESVLNYKVVVSTPVTPNKSSTGLLTLNIENNEFWDKTSSSWWNSAWGKCIAFSTTTTTPSNYTHTITLNTTLINYSDFQASGQDIRILEGNCTNHGSGELSYNRKSWDTNGDSIIDVRAINSSVTNLSVYYNNTGASEGSNAVQTYLYLFNGTIDGTTDLTATIGTLSYDSGGQTINWTGAITNGQHGVYVTSLTSYDNLTANITIAMIIKDTSWDAIRIYERITSSTSSYYSQTIMQPSGVNHHKLYRDATIILNNPNNCQIGNYSYYNVIANQLGSNISFSKFTNATGSCDALSYIDGTKATGSVGYSGYQDTGNNSFTSIKYFEVKKSHTTEPVWVGGVVETSSGGGGNNASFNSQTFSPANNSAYTLSKNVSFSINITNGNGTAGIQIATTNYTAVNSSLGNYTVNITNANFSATTTTITWWSYGTDKSINTTSVHYTVAKASPTGSLTNNESWTISYGKNVVIGLSESNSGDADLTYVVSRENVSKGTGETILLPGNKSYVYVLNTSGGANYSQNANMQTQVLTVNREGQTLTTLLNGVANNLTITYPQQVNVSVTGNKTEITINVNGTTFTNSQNYTLGGNVWFANVSVIDNENYTRNESDWYITISRATPSMSVSCNNIEYPASPNCEGTETNVNDSDVTYTLYRDGVSVSNPDTTTDLAISTYYYNFTATQGQNYSYRNVTTTAVISQNTTHSILPLLNHNNANLVVTYSQQINMSFNQTNVTQVIIEINGTEATKGTNYTWGGGGWTAEFNLSGNTNYSQKLYYYNITVNRAGQTMTVLLNGVANNLTVTYPQQINISVSNNETNASIIVNGTYLNNSINYTLGGNVWFANVSAILTQNYSSNESNWYITINRATSSITSLINGSSLVQQNITYPSQVNFSATRDNSEQTLELFRNGTGMVSLNHIFQNLMSSYYNFTARANQTQNYTSLSSEKFVNITKGTAGLHLWVNNAESNASINNGTTIRLNVTLDAGNGRRTLFNNGTLLGNMTSDFNNNTLFDTISLYNVSTNYEGNENYTRDWITWFVNVILPATSSGGGGGVIYTPNKVESTNGYVCERTFEYIQNYGQSNYYYLNDTKNEIFLDRGINVSVSQLKDYLSLWQPTCSDVINRTLHEGSVCNKIYYNLIANNDTHTPITVSVLRNVIKTEDKIDLSSRLITQYMDEYPKKCQPITNLKLPFSRNIPSLNLNKLFEAPSCSVETNNSLVDVNIPFFAIGTENTSCSAIESKRWFFKMEQSESGSYEIVGLRLWFALSLVGGGWFMWRKFVSVKRRGNALTKLLEKGDFLKPRI